MPKITSQQIEAVRTYMMKQIKKFVHKKNTTELDILKKKAQPSIAKLEKIVKQVAADIAKFNTNTRKTQGNNFGPIFSSPFMSDIRWMNNHNKEKRDMGYNSFTGHNEHTLSIANKEKIIDFTDEMDLFLLKLQLQETAQSDIDKFLKKLLK